MPGDLGCNLFENGICVNCSFGYYFDRNRLCKLIPETCASFNIPTETCRGCYSGFELDENNQCVRAKLTEVGDVGCNEF